MTDYAEVSQDQMLLFRHQQENLCAPELTNARRRRRAPLNHIAEISPELSFNEAFPLWIDRRVLKHAFAISSAKYISERTEWDYRQYARALAKEFGKMRLCDITLDHILEYSQARAFCDGDWDRKAGANRIRKEVGMLVRVMRAAKVWTEYFDEQFTPLAVAESDVQRALDPDEQKHFLATAASRQRWEFVLHYSIAALQTTAATNEMRGVRLGDLNLQAGAVMVRSATAKNKYRIRTIPLESREVMWAFEQLRARAGSMGAWAPHHYLFPIMARKNTYDPTRMMSDSGLKKVWDEVRTAAGIPWLRPYDLRHTGITRMAEAGTPIPVIMSFAGHMSLKMQQHYTTISMQAKRKAAASTWNDPNWTPAESRVATGTYSDTQQIRMFKKIS